MLFHRVSVATSFSKTRPIVSGIICKPCVRNGPSNIWRARHDSNVRPLAPQAPKRLRRNGELALRLTRAPHNTTYDLTWNGLNGTIRRHIDRRASLSKISNPRGTSRHIESLGAAESRVAAAMIARSSSCRVGVFMAHRRLQTPICMPHQEPPRQVISSRMTWPIVSAASPTAKIGGSG